MTFNLNFDPKLLRSAVDALVQLANDYHSVHRDQIEQDARIEEHRRQYKPTKGAVFYQSDKKLHEDEVKQRLRAEAESGGLH